jgi:hypothetical protein
MERNENSGAEKEDALSTEKHRGPSERNGEHPPAHRHDHGGEQLAFPVDDDLGSPFHAERAPFPSREAEDAGTDSDAAHGGEQLVLPVEDEVDSLWKGGPSQATRGPKTPSNEPLLGEPSRTGEPARAAGPETLRDDAAAALLLPDEADYSIRPESPSERFIEPDVETTLLRAMLYGKNNFPAILGVVLAVFGILANVWGIVLASLGLVFSGVGVWAGTHGARRLWLAVAGVVIALLNLTVTVI